MNLAAKPQAAAPGKNVNLEALRHRNAHGHRVHHKRPFHGKKVGGKRTKKVQEDIVFDRPTWADFPGYGWGAGAWGAAPYGAWGFEGEFPGAWGAAAPFYGAGWGANWEGVAGPWSGAWGAAPFDAFTGYGAEFPGAWGVAAPYGYGAEWAGAWDALNGPWAGPYGAVEGWNGLGAWNGAWNGAYGAEFGFPAAGYGFGAWGAPLAEPYLDVPNYTWLP